MNFKQVYQKIRNIENTQAFQQKFWPRYNSLYKLVYI